MRRRSVLVEALGLPLDPGEKRMQVLAPADIGERKQCKGMDVQGCGEFSDLLQCGALEPPLQRAHVGAPGYLSEILLGEPTCPPSPLERAPESRIDSRGPHALHLAIWYPKGLHPIGFISQGCPRAKLWTDEAKADWARLDYRVRHKHLTAARTPVRHLFSWALEGVGEGTWSAAGMHVMAIAAVTAPLLIAIALYAWRKEHRGIQAERREFWKRHRFDPLTECPPHERPPPWE